MEGMYCVAATMGFLGFLSGCTAAGHSRGARALAHKRAVFDPDRASLHRSHRRTHIVVGLGGRAHHHGTPCTAHASAKRTFGVLDTRYCVLRTVLQPREQSSTAATRAMLLEYSADRAARERGLPVGDRALNGRARTLRRRGQRQGGQARQACQGERSLGGAGCEPGGIAQDLHRRSTGGSRRDQHARATRSRCNPLP